jgi:hypothetical protein
MKLAWLLAIVGALLGAVVGSGIGIAGLGSAIAGTFPIGALGAYFGYRIGKWLSTRAS